MPSNRFTVGLPEIIKPLTRAIPKATVASIENGKSLLVISFVILIRFSYAQKISRLHTPTTTRRLKRLEPTTFPTAISFAPCNEDEILTAVSGAEVPIAITVSPIIMLGIFRE